jgi:hypothetical protein
MVLKEIKETRINLKIIKRKPVLVHQKVDVAFKEANELMAIFITNVETAKGNAINNKKDNSKNNNAPK